MKGALSRICIAFLLMTVSAFASADVVTDWNEQAVAAGYKASAGSGNARTVAMVHVAMFEALNSIEPRYTPYRKRLPVESGASRDAAGAAAACIRGWRRIWTRHFRLPSPASPKGLPK
jgi:hypothetical protein